MEGMLENVQNFVCVCTVLLFSLLFCCSQLLLSGHLGLVKVLSLPNMAAP